MKFDIARAVGAVVREVSDRNHEGKPARSVVATRSYNTSVEDLWDALTDADRIPRWFLPIGGDLRLGGRYQLEGNAAGEITRCEPPLHLAVTWEMQGDVSWVEVTLAPISDGQSSLRLEHIAHVPEELWEQYGAGATGVGWDLGLLGLDQYFAEEPVVVPEQAEEWALSPDGRAFARQSSDAWALASIEGGEDRSKALAAAARTTAFYTGEEEASDPELVEE